MRKLRLLSLLPILFLVACATTPEEQFKKVKVGMYKDEVLELMESPQRTERRKGQDRWTYVYFHNSNLQHKQVQFEEGKANYVGELMKPAISADEQDRMNEDSNHEVEIALQAKKTIYEKDYSNYLDSNAADGKSPRYVPQFRPIEEGYQNGGGNSSGAPSTSGGGAN